MACIASPLFHPVCSSHGHQDTYRTTLCQCCLRIFQQGSLGIYFDQSWLRIVQQRSLGIHFDQSCLRIFPSGRLRTTLCRCSLRIFLRRIFRTRDLIESCTDLYHMACIASPLFSPVCSSRGQQNTYRTTLCQCCLRIFQWRSLDNPSTHHAWIPYYSLTYQ